MKVKHAIMKFTNQDYCHRPEFRGVLKMMLSNIAVPLSFFILSLLPSLVVAQNSWRQVTVPSVREAAASFATPPSEYGAIHWAIWGGQQTRERIVADIEQIYANGGRVYMINNSRGLLPKYFTPEYLVLVKLVMQECKKRGMKVWIEGDAGYPDGFAGGMISRDYPNLGMQGIVADARYTVAGGQTLKIPLPPETLGILVNQRMSARGSVAAPQSEVIPLPSDGQFQWTAPNQGMWEVNFVRHVFRSSPTRYVNREDGTNAKDSRYSLIDYLNPDATRTYLKIIFETYEKLVGDEFGKTILGFRGDEPDYTGFMPWTPKLPETFQKEKGYDLKPYIAQFFAGELTPEAKRAKADYWDVWSSMFRDNFFKPMEDWCAVRKMEYMAHLNHEELMINLTRGEDLIRNEGSFFRDLRYVGVPGIDNLSQIKPGIIADFPKLASSAAHLFGRPQIWTEQGGSVGPSGKFVTDYQFVRGINYMNIRGLNTAPSVDANPATTGWYVSRASYLLAIGRPAAQVALYHPTDSEWLGDQEADSVTVKLTTQLLEQQIDFDYIDYDSFTQVCTLEKGGIKNLSGQIYRAIIIPTSTVIQKKMLELLRAFAAAGGKVVFVGRTPTMVVDRTFLNPEAAPDLSFATLESTPAITPRVVSALPKPDVELDATCASVKYIHRSLKDGDIYFFFNESDQTQSRTATLTGKGQTQVWDAISGKIEPLKGTRSGKETVSLPLVLAPYESRFIVIGPTR
ncbi:MAG: glycosyl hydrolase [Bacteroidia bacterium]|nr:glycosyl hydrolase [Bacteroidia bacterium]